MWAETSSSSRNRRRNDGRGSRQPASTDLWELFFFFLSFFFIISLHVHKCLLTVHCVWSVHVTTAFSQITTAVRSCGHRLHLQTFQRRSVFWRMVSQFCGVFWTVPHAASVLAGYQIVFCFYMGPVTWDPDANCSIVVPTPTWIWKDVSNHMLPVLNGFPLSPLTTPEVLATTCIYIYIYIRMELDLQHPVYIQGVYICIYIQSVLYMNISVGVFTDTFKLKFFISISNSIPILILLT